MRYCAVLRDCCAALSIAFGRTSYRSYVQIEIAILAAEDFIYAAAIWPVSFGSIPLVTRPEDYDSPGAQMRHLARHRCEAIEIRVRALEYPPIFHPRTVPIPRGIRTI